MIVECNCEWYEKVFEYIECFLVIDCILVIYGDVLEIGE